MTFQSSTTPVSLGKIRWTMNKAISFLLLCAPICLFAQENNPDNWRYYKSMENVTCHLETDTEVWLGTRSGIAAIDKATFAKTIYDTNNSALPSPSIEAIRQDEEGNIWIGTYDYILAMKSGDNWIEMSVPVDPGFPATAQPHLYDFDIAEDGSFWIATNNGLWHKKEGIWEVYNSENGNIPGNAVGEIWAVEEDDGKVYFAGLKLYRLIDGVVENLSDTNNQITFYGSDNTHIHAHDGTFAVHNHFIFIAKFAEDSTSFNMIGDGNFPNNNSSFMVSFLPSGDIRVFFLDGERYLLSGNNWTLQPNSLESVFTDYPLNKYFFRAENDETWAIDHLTLYKATDNSYQSQTINELPLTTNISKRFVAMPDNSLYMLEANNHLIRFHPAEGWSTIPVPDTIASYYGLYDMKQYQSDRLCFLTNEGPLWYDGEHWQTITDCPLSNTHWLATNVNGDLYVANQQQAAHYDGQNWTTHDIPGPAQGPPYIALIEAAPNGDLWIVKQNSIFQFDGTIWHEYTHNNADIPSSFGSGGMAFEEDGTVWVACGSGGISRFDGTNWTTFDEEENIHTSRDVTIAPDGTIWAATTPAVVHFDGSEWHMLDTSNSLLTIPHSHQIRVTYHGSIWINGYEEGLNVYHPNGFVQTQTNTPQFDQQLIFPNPAAEVIHLKGELGDAANYAIFDSNGQTISAGDVQHDRIPIQQLSSGVYFLKVTTATGIRSGKFVVGATK